MNFHLVLALGNQELYSCSVPFRFEPDADRKSPTTNNQGAFTAIPAIAKVKSGMVFRIDRGSEFAVLVRKKKPKADSKPVAVSAKKAVFSKAGTMFSLPCYLQAP